MADHVVLLDYGHVVAAGVPVEVSPSNGSATHTGCRSGLDRRRRRRAHQAGAPAEAGHGLVTSTEPPATPATRLPRSTNRPEGPSRHARISPRRAVLAPPVVAALVALGACGTTEAPASSQPTTAAAARLATVTDARGKTVTLPGAGHPCGRDRAGRGRAARHPRGAPGWRRRPEGVCDVGLRGAAGADGSHRRGYPNRAQRRRHRRRSEPDLVVVEKGTAAESVLPQLEKYVPAIVTTARTPRGTWPGGGTTSPSSPRRPAPRTRSPRRSPRWAPPSPTRRRPSPPGQGGDAARRHLRVRAGRRPAIRVSGKGSLVQDLGEGVGLTTAWTGEADKDWGLGATDVEGLEVLTDPNTSSSTSPPTAPTCSKSTLSSNPIGNRLPFVKAGNVASFRTRSGPTAAGVGRAVRWRARRRMTGA